MICKIVRMLGSAVGLEHLAVTAQIQAAQDKLASTGIYEPCAVGVQRSQLHDMSGPKKDGMAEKF